MQHPSLALLLSQHAEPQQHEAVSLPELDAVISQLATIHPPCATSAEDQTTLLATVKPRLSSATHVVAKAIFPETAHSQTAEMRRLAERSATSAVRLATSSGTALRAQ